VSSRHDSITVSNIHAAHLSTLTSHAATVGSSLLRFQHASKPLPLQALSKHVDAPVMTAAEALPTPTGAWSLVRDPLPKRGQLGELDGSVFVVDSEECCEIFADPVASVLQLSEWENPVPLEVRLAVQRRDYAFLDKGEKR
jgi:hypothetical protein